MVCSNNQGALCLGMLQAVFQQKQNQRLCGVGMVPHVLVPVMKKREL